MKMRTIRWAAAAVVLTAGSALFGCSSSAQGLSFEASANQNGTAARRAASRHRNPVQGAAGASVGSPLAWEYGRNDAYQPMSPAFAPAGVSAVYQRDSQRTIHGEPLDTFIRRTWTYERTVR